jgi:hypothetical protein
MKSEMMSAMHTALLSDEKYTQRKAELRARRQNQRNNHQRSHAHASLTFAKKDSTLLALCAVWSLSTVAR